ncbi:E3 ubiquitin-protein ligase, partial [Mucuna pruriens]
MNSRCFLHPQDSSMVPLSSNSSTGARNRPPRVTPPSFLVRMAMRISRARWFTLLRRVFHYQNGSRSNLGSNPFNSRTWMMLEFIALVVQITITTFTLAISKRERPVWPMRIWISGYDIGCVLNLLLLYGRYRQIYLTQPDALSLSDMEQQRNNEETRMSHLMNKCQTSLELFFAIWFVMGNVWVFDSRFGSFHQAPKLHVLCITLLAWNAICYSFPFLLFLLLCCCVPLISTLLGYNMNVASSDRGASDDQISQLSSWRHNEPPTNLEHGNDSEGSEKLINEDPECCICLAKYKDKEEVRQLPCSHMFHQKCVDQWLKITSCCPLCKQGLERMEKNVEKKDPSMNATKLSGREIKIPGLNMDDIKQQSHMLVSPTSEASMRKSSTERWNCLCSPTTHAGSFRCRRHRATGMTHASSIGSNLSSMTSKHSFQAQ